MAYINILKGTPTWLPFVAVNDDDGDPRTGILYSEVEVIYKKYGQATFSVKTLTGAGVDFRENGNGVYEILFSALELNTEGSFLYVINGTGALALPEIRQYLGQAFVQSSTSYTPGSITLSTNVLTGNLVDLLGTPLVGESVSARILAAPVITGSSPNIGGVSTNMTSVQTDSSGFFALEVLQGSELDIVIPIINYRRTLTVPANSTDKLFELP